MPNSPDQIRHDFVVLEKRLPVDQMTQATEREYLDCIRNLNSEDQNAIESIDGPTVAQLINPKIAAARRMWDSLPHEAKLKIAFSAIDPSNQSAA